jgi:hypothetical protein
MLRLRLPAIVFLAAVLGGCVIVPERQYALVLDAGGTVTQRWLTCADPAPPSIAGAEHADAHAVPADLSELPVECWQQLGERARRTGSGNRTPFCQV